MTKKYLLYFDDTGSRDPDKNPYKDNRDDSMNCFGLGGILIKEEDVEEVLQKHKEFCGQWNIDYPLHSSSIRGGRKQFAWLRTPENSGLFIPALQDYLMSLPITGIACVIDRPGYVKRYKERYNDHLWFMCKSAFTILIERSAKFADRNGRKLEVFFEQTGKKEDRDLEQYLSELKESGNPFDTSTSNSYQPFKSEDYKRIILGKPQRKTKKVPMIQIADLILYPMAKGGYDPNYYPYRKLVEAGKLIDSHLEENERSSLGIKYSCFDEKKTK